MSEGHFDAAAFYAALDSQRQAKGLTWKQVAAAPTPQAAATTNTAWAPAPVTFVYADSADVSHIDPALITDFWSFSVTRNAYDPLVEIADRSPEFWMLWINSIR